MKNKKPKQRMILSLGIIFILLLSPLAFSASYSRYTAQVSQPGGSANYLSRQGIALGNDWDDGKCEAGQDFVLQINPAGCTPSVVRSDLLEEQNVPVFCPISATKINPLIEVDAIKSLKFSFNGSTPKEISGVGFHPANAALKTSDILLNTPILENVGYAVIVLKQQKNESAMPDFVDGKLNVDIEYDIKNAFGIGKGTYYLPELNDEEWSKNYHLYGFWNNKFYLRAEDIGINDANVAIYTSEDLRLSGHSLTAGKTSNTIYLPGQYCKAGVELRLDSLENPGTRVRLRVGDDVIEAVKDERFLDNRCRVTSITESKVVVSCTGSGTEKSRSIELPRILVASEENEYYSLAIENYEQVANGYPDERATDLETFKEDYYGKQALDDAISLTNEFEKTDDKSKLESLKTKIYGNENQAPTSISSKMVLINGVYQTISLLDVVEPSFEDYGVEVQVEDVNPVFSLDSNHKTIIQGGVTLELINIRDNYATVKMTVNNNAQTFQLVQGETLTHAKSNKYIKATAIHLTKVAKVTLTPKINYAETDSTISFKIGIEKRAIDLSPERIRKMIDNLNETIEEWQDASDKLGNVVKGLKGACLATGAALTVKNLFTGLSGGSIARQKTMERAREYCKPKIAIGDFKTFEKCFADPTTEKMIESDYESINSVIQSQDEKLEAIRKESILKSEIWGEDIVDNGVYLRKQTAMVNEELELPNGEEIKEGQASITQLQELQYYDMLAKSASSKELKGEAVKEKSALLVQIKNKPVQTPIDPEKLVYGYIKEPKVIYSDRAPNQGVPSIIPIPDSASTRELGSDKGHGWYVGISYMATGSTYESGLPKFFSVCNVLEDNQTNFESSTGGIGGDCCTTFSGGNYGGLEICGLDEKQSQKLYNIAYQAYNQAASAYKKDLKTVEILGVRMEVALGASLSQTTCYDFMDPDDCKILFNVCDPVVCPSSRCNFGGAYYLPDVIQSGILGSTLACLDNFGNPAEGGVAIPVCLTGIHAGIEGLLSVFKAHRDCLQSKLETGQTIGFCDEIYSIQLCDFFWKQVAPFAGLIIPKMIEFVTGKFVRGGGEYRGVETAWQNAEKSVDYFTQYYAVNAFKMFQAKSITEVGSEVCRNYLSTSIPEGKSFLDAMTDPVSPPQFHGWLDYSLYTGVTENPANQYSVFYHIYGGTEKDEVEYLVYLKGTGNMAGRTVKVASGKILKGGYKTEKKDFLEYAGFTEMCIVVGTQEECGFGEVTTSFALNTVKDKFVEQQASERDINTRDECVSGTYSGYSVLNPNLQSGAQDFVNPDIQGIGITRVCSTTNPGAGTDSTRWEEVGNCGDANLKCWLDKKSIEQATSRKNITETGILTEAEKLENSLRENYYSSEEAKSILGGLNRDIESAYAPEFYLVDSSAELQNILKNISNIENGESGMKKMFENNEKAALQYLKAKAYDRLARLHKGEKDVATAVATTEKGEEVVPSGQTTTEVCKKEPCSNKFVMAGDACRKITGAEVIRIAREVKEAKISKDEKEWSDKFSKLREDIDVDCFEQLVLMVARQEGCLTHCIYKNGETNPLYCRTGEDHDSVIVGDDGKSIGIMQINSEAHDKEYWIFEENVEKGAEYLINRYESCKNWNPAVGAYNAGTCRKDSDYLKNVKSRKYEIFQLFPDACKTNPPSSDDSSSQFITA